MLRLRRTAQLQLGSLAKTLPLVLVILAGAQPGLTISSLARAETIDPDNDGSQYAWAENLGWLNAEPLGDGGPGMRVLEERVDGWIWSENAGWISLSCSNTRSCSRASFGVTNDGSGNLSGFAWGENIGWISFSCESTSSCASVDYGVRVDGLTGEFSGWAWAENGGWISFSCQNTGSCGAVDYGIKTETPFLPTEIFSDGFESGDTSAWSRSVP